MPMSMTQRRAARVEARVGRASARSPRAAPSARRAACLSSIQPRNCQIARKSSMSLISGVPVSAIISGPDDPLPDLLGELQHVLGALRRLVLDEVRLVDDHAAEAVVADPADVPVEHLVVDDRRCRRSRRCRRRRRGSRWRCGRGSRRSTSRAQLVLTTLGTTTSSGIGVGGLRGEQRLRGLAEARLVGEQEGAVTQRPHATSCAWWCISSRPAGGLQRGRLRQRHAGRRAGAGELEGPEERTEQLPGRQPVGAAAWAARRRSQGRGTGWPAGGEITDCGHDPALVDRVRDVVGSSGASLGLGLEAGRR